MDRTIEDLINQVMADYKIEPVQMGASDDDTIFREAEFNLIFEEVFKRLDKIMATEKKPKFPTF